MTACLINVHNALDIITFSLNSFVFVQQNVNAVKRQKASKIIRMYLILRLQKQQTMQIEKL